MGIDRLGDHNDGGAAPSRSIDSGPDEGELEGTDRGEVGIVGVVAELESDQPGTPGGVFPLEIAGDAEQLLDSRGDRATTGVIVGSQSVEAVSAVRPPDVADRAIGDREVDSDLGQGDALLTTLDDLLTERDRDRARHGSRLRESEEKDHSLTKG